MGKLEEKQQEKRKKIFQAATNLFAFGGYNDTTISKIAKEAGISFGSVFTYYETKEALFEAVIVEPLENMKQRVLKVPEQPFTIEKYKKFTSQHIDFFKEQRTFLLLIQQVLGQPDKFPILFKKLDDFYDEWVVYLIDIIQAGQIVGFLEKNDPVATARGYISFLIGIRLTLADEPAHPVWSHFYEIANRILGVKGE